MYQFPPIFPRKKNQNEFCAIFIIESEENLMVEESCFFFFVENNCDSVKWNMRKC